MLRGLYSIGSEQRFVDALAAGVSAAYGRDPATLADVLILVPTRRAVRALQDAFLRHGNGRAAILPRLQPLGDIDEPELQLAALAGESGLAADLPPAVPDTLRNVLLARQVMEFHALGRPVAGSAAQALQLARELGALLDELLIEGVAFSALETLVDAPYAEHWQRVVGFLQIVGKFWPQILAESGSIDAIDRRNRLLRAQAAAWRAQPPETPVIAAGTTGSQPATRDLLQAISELPRGAIVLPGLDHELDAASWAALDPSHPQFGLRELLAALGVERQAVRDWPNSAGSDAARRSLLSELMRPAATTELWSDRHRPSPQALDHVVRVDCSTEQQEATVAALAMRKCLETAGRTAALVTPDRGLARRVVAELARWGIEVDDSAGVPLQHTPPATLLALIAAAVDCGFAPVALLALLKHPLCALGLERGEVLAAARLIDRSALRGATPTPGLEALRQRLARSMSREPSPDAGAAQAAAIEPAQLVLDRLEAALAPLVTLCTAGSGQPGEFLAATLRAGEAAAATEQRSGAESLWSGDAGEALARFAADGLPWIDRLGSLSAAQWPATLATLLQGQTVRPRYGVHPRLAIWGPLEARLQRADLVILAGLNEGTWPRLPETGPWLNRPMRSQLGLPQPERRIGLAAHDFIAAFAADGVMLLRAERVDGAPTVPARWLSRLDALLGWDASADNPPPAYIERGRRWRGWAEALDRPEVERSIERPQPRPPLAVRPRQLSVSAIEQWRRDPYGLYARHILRLRRLEGLEETVVAAERGEALHAILDGFCREFPATLPDDALERLLQRGRRELAMLFEAPTERAFWWPRFRRLAAWFVATERQRRSIGILPIALERRGRLIRHMPAGDFIVTARADRLDRAADGAIDIIDYKSGRVPSPKELNALFAPQLLLEAAMARAGGFEELDAATRVDLHYWSINGLARGGDIVAVPRSDELVAAMLELLDRTIAEFDNPATPYLPTPWPAFLPHFNDYDHLERSDEWSLPGAIEGGGS